jgi:tRNA(Ile)-lysidine synthase TilS/MesJ
VVDAGVLQDEGGLESDMKQKWELRNWRSEDLGELRFDSVKNERDICTACRRVRQYLWIRLASSKGISVPAVG